MWDAEQGEGSGGSTRAVGGDPSAPIPPQELLSFTQGLWRNVTDKAATSMFMNLYLLCL